MLITFDIIILYFWRYVYNYKDADFDELQELWNYIPWDVVYDENDMYFSTVKWVDLFLQLLTIVSPRLR